MKPNVLCIGFAKCGTTTLYDIMKQHPDIYLSGIKEPIYYGNSTILEKKSFEWYKKRYYPSKTNKKVIMEINPVIGKYVSPLEIKKNYGRNIKILFLIRNPIKRLYSNFIMNLKRGDCFNKIDDNLGQENILFEDWVVNNFLMEDGTVINNSVIPKFCKSGNYYSVIKNYIETFGKDNVNVVLFEDFIKNPKQECEKIFKFIKVKNDDSINFNIVSNEGNRVPYNKTTIKITRAAFKLWENVVIKKVPYISYKFSNRLNNMMWKSTELLTKKVDKKEILYCSNLILTNYYKQMCVDLGQLLNVNLLKKWDIKNMPIKDEDLIVLRMKKKYSNELYKIQKEYYKCAKRYNLKRFKAIIEKHNKTVINIVNDVLNSYPRSASLQFAALNGSFARKTNIFDSDIDLTIFSKVKTNEELAQELKISYVLSRVLDFKGCDRIHPVMVHTKANKQIKFEINNNQIIIADKYKCPCYYRKGNDETLNDTIISSRDYKDFIKYVNEMIESRVYFNNWMNNFKLIQDYGDYGSFHMDLIKFEERIKENYKKTELKNKLNTIYKKLMEGLEVNDVKELKVSELKYKHKGSIIKPLLDLLFILRLLSSEEKSKRKEKQILKILYSQLFIILRLKLVLKELGHDLSSHSSEIISKAEFTKLCCKNFNKKNIFKSEKKNIKMALKIIKYMEEKYV